MTKPINLVKNSVDQTVALRGRRTVGYICETSAPYAEGPWMAGVPGKSPYVDVLSYHENYTDAETALLDHLA